MGAVAIPSSEGRRYIEGFFFLPLNISALAVEHSWFWYLSAPSIERLWFPESRRGVVDSLGLLLGRGVEPDLGVATLGVGVVALVGVREPTEDFPEETEETEERGLPCLLILSGVTV